MAKEKQKIQEKELKEKEVEQIKKVKIKIVGIGGGGGNIVNEVARKISNIVDFCVIDSDIKSFANLPKNVEKFILGEKISRGLGTGMDLELASKLFKEDKEKLQQKIQGYDLVILISTLGGGISTKVSILFSHLLETLGILSYGIFTLPFSFEGEKKMTIAKEALGILRKTLNAITFIPNDQIFTLMNENTEIKKAFSAINGILANNLKNLIEVIFYRSLINIDFADFKTILENKKGIAYLHSGFLEKKPSLEAIEGFFNFPLYPYGIEGAKGVILHIGGPKNLSLTEVAQISNVIAKKVSKDASIIFGLSPKKELNKILITIFTCGSENFPQKYFVERKIRKLPPPRKQFLISKEKGQEKVNIERKNGLKIREEVEKEEKEILSKEEKWETPTFLRKGFST
jgi:cell division protein FtsZ